MLALVDAFRQGLLAPRFWIQNILAGVMVGIIAVPLSMAFAIASGAKPEQGLYTAIVAGLAVTCFGGSRVQIAGPTGAFVAILVSITAKFGMDGLQIATFFAGLILMVFGVSRIGSVVKFVPEPVIVGFTSGIAVIIFLGQWPNFFGFPNNLPLDASAYRKILYAFEHLPHAMPSSMAIVGFVYSL